MKRLEKILHIIDEETQKAIAGNTLDTVTLDTLYISQLAGVDRTNASKLMNRLWREGSLIKIQSHPVVYLSRGILQKAYDTDNIPNTIFKGDSITRYLKEKGTSAPELEDPAEKIIGADGSLHDQIRDAKSAIMYPPYGLPLLVIGNPGVNKLKIASYLHEYAQKSGRKPASSKFILIECSGYHSAESVSSFISLIFGSAKENDRGYLSACGHGTLYFSNLHLLHPIARNAITDLLDRGMYTREGDSASHTLACSIIASATPEKTADLDYLSRYFPVTIHIPDIDQRGIYEKTEEVLALFEQEAVSIKRTIRISKDILDLFVQMDYPENLSGMRAEVKQACARAFLASSESLSTIIVSYQHLSLKMLSSREQVSRLSAVRGVLSLIDTDYILFEANGHCTTLEILQKLPSQLEVSRFDQFLDQLDTDTSSVISVSDFISENISTIVNCGNAQLKKIDIQINPVVSQIFEESLQKTSFEESYSRNPRLLKGLMLHITNRLNQLEEHGDTGAGIKIESSRDLVEGTIKIADTIVERLESIFHISFPKSDRYFIAMYLTIAGKWDQKEMVPLLIISHGKSIATQLKEYLDTIYRKQLPVSAIDYIPDMQMNDLLELVTIRCNELDHGQGIIIAADGNPFENVSDYIVSTLHIRCRCVKCSSLDGLMNIADRISRYQSLEQIMLNISSETNTPASSAYQPVSSGSQSIIYRLTNEFLQPSMTFLYASKAVDALMLSLSGILEDLNLPYTNELAIKFLCHSVNMLERVIRLDPLPYPKVNSFIRSNLKVYQAIEKNLQNVNELYGISIPKEEIAYITEILLEPLNAETSQRSSS